jgi:hypothetical protein
MTTALAERTYLAVPLFAACGLVLGALASAQPKLALGLLAAVVVVVLAFRTPVANLVVLVAITALVPYELQNRFGVGGGTQSPGLLLSDLLLVVGLIWALLVLSGETLDRRRFLYVALLLAFLVVVGLQFVHGIHAGRDRSRVGQEARVLLGFGTFLMAMPLLVHPRARRRLLVALTAGAVVLGAWGMLQWFGHFSYGVNVGVRPGVSLTTAGTGQLQGGEYAFPAAIVMCFALLISGSIHSFAARVALVAGIVLNGASCLVTFERTFWLSALLGMGVVLVRARAVQRVKVLLVAPIAALVAVAAVGVAAPNVLTTAQQRLLSLGQYTSDKSVRYRVVESRFVVHRIRAHPVEGSGLAATIFWGRPWDQVPPKTYPFAHNGYLWLAWKVGIPSAALLVFLLGSAVFLRAPPEDDALDRALRHGAQGALAGLLLASVTFPSFSNLSITSVMGLLLAVAVSPAARTDSAWTRPAGKGSR